MTRLHNQRLHARPGVIARTNVEWRQVNKLIDDRVDHDVFSYVYEVNEAVWDKHGRLTRYYS